MPLPSLLLALPGLFHLCTGLDLELTCIFRREAFYCLILGYCTDVIPMVLNGAIGADLHINFATAARSSFGFYLARFAVVVRMITALFWHGKNHSADFHKELNDGG